jgi:signal transduction histidine kinase
VRRIEPRWLVLAAALTLTVAATIAVFVSSRQRDEARFANAVQAAADRVVGRLDAYIVMLRGGAGLFAAAEPDSESFARYVERLDIPRWYPGIQGIGWSARIAVQDSAELDEWHVIQFLEPRDARNMFAIGYDMYSDSMRREAMRRARDQALPAMSGRVRLIQEIYGPEQPGFLIYVPVYAGAGIPASVDERRRRLRGFVYAPFRAGDLFEGVFGTEQQPRVNLAVYDGTATGTGPLLFATGQDTGRRPRHRTRTSVNVAGRDWTLVFESRPGFEAASTRRLAPAVAIVGLLVSLWLFRLAVRLSRARQAAESANRAKSTFLANMSHELRTPLNAIAGYTDLMLLGVPGALNDEQKRYLDRIRYAQQHLLRLISDVLEFAKLEAGRIDYALKAVPARDLVHDTVSLLAPHAADRNIELVVSGGPDVRLMGDADKVRQILLNLYSNALKFTGTGGRVDTRWHAADGHVEISVTDTGIGIPADRIDTVFEPFMQVDDNLTRRQEGTGLGLAISRELVDGMGGTIVVQSVEGSGTTFRVTLPVAP